MNGKNLIGCDVRELEYGSINVKMMLPPVLDVLAMRLRLLLLTIQFLSSDHTSMCDL